MLFPRVSTKDIAIGKHNLDPFMQWYRLHVISIMFYLRNRFALAVIYCLIYHWLEVSRQSE